MRRPLPRHTQRGRHAFGTRKRRLDGLAHLVHVQLFRHRLIRQHIAHRPRRRGCIGKRALQRDRLVVDVVFAFGKRDAALIPEILRRADDSVRKRDVHGLRLLVDFAIGQLLPRLVRRAEVANVLGRELEVEASNEDRGAQDLREARRVMLERVARGRFVASVELERSRARDERLFGCHVRIRLRRRRIAALVAGKRNRD